MPEDTCQNLFEPYFTTKPRGDGTGLGMAITAKLIKKHKGKISVESNLGEGTTFKLTFPSIHSDKDGSTYQDVS